MPRSPWLRFAAVIAAVVVGSCTESGTGQVETNQDSRTALTMPDTVVMPSLSEDATWFERPRSIHPGADGTLWVIDKSSGVLTQFSTAGEFIRTLGAKGQGPGEIENPTDFLDLGSRLVVLDRPGRKIVVFRPDGGLAFEIPVASVPDGVAAIDDSTYAVVPGAKNAIDLYSRSGFVMGLGAPMFDTPSCRGCEIGLLPDQRVVVAEPARPQLVVFDLQTGGSRTVDLRGDLGDWLERAERDWAARENTPSRKNWIGHLIGVSAGRVDLLMVGYSPGREGTELWSVDLSSSAVSRSTFNGDFVVAAAIVDGSVFGLLSGSRGVLNYGNLVAAESSPTP